MKKLLIASCMAASLLISSSVFAGAAKTTYPIVYAHGMGGFDNLLGLNYWGDDYGVFVGDACDEFLEITCNSNISSSQKSYAAQVQAFQSSEVRGLDLANDTESFMALTGATRVNLVGHSQGTIDVRKAAYVLKQRKGYAVVRVLVSISGPHRGSPIAKYMLDLSPGIISVIDALARMYGNIIYQAGNDGYAAAKQFVYNDWSATDGKTTGMKAFNVLYPNSSAVVYRYVSLITAQEGLSVNPAMWITKSLYNIDGDGYCVDDCDNDGAGGKGDGNRSNTDDDGLVGINSQQLGWRLQYNECFLCFDSITTNTSLGEASANNPTSAQMTSKASVIQQDHFDVVGAPPDTFNEMEFYGALTDYIAYYD